MNEGARDESPARQVFDSLNTTEDLNLLVETAACEDLFLECKDQTSPVQISRDVLAKMLSGFSNTSGGVILWGAHTDKKDGNDVVTELFPVGNVETFRKRINNTLPTLTVPAVLDYELKVISEKGHTKGHLVAYIKAKKAPVQSLHDDVFYIRAGDQFVKAPYDFIQRMFMAEDAPDIEVAIPEHLLSYDQSTNKIALPIGLDNNSLATGKEVVCTIKVLQHNNLISVTGDKELVDLSSLNTNKKLFKHVLRQVLHKGLPTIVGTVYFELPSKTKTIEIYVTIFADRMIAKTYTLKVTLSKSSPKAEVINSKPF